MGPLPASMQKNLCFGGGFMRGLQNKYGLLRGFLRKKYNYQYMIKKLSAGMAAYKTNRGG